MSNNHVVASAFLSAGCIFVGLYFNSCLVAFGVFCIFTPVTKLLADVVELMTDRRY
jgi:uncharacterized membrane protein